MIALTSLLICAPSFTQAPDPPKMTLPQIMRSVDFYEDHLKGAESWKTSAGKYVDLKYISGNESKAQADAQLMDRAVTRDCGVLNLPLPDSKIPVYFFPNADSLDHALGIKGASQSGISLGAWAVIVSKPQLSFGVLGDAAAHELGHAIVHKNLGLFGCPFLAEGIAYYLQARFDNSAWLKNPSPVENKTIFQLVQSSIGPKDFNQGAHFFGYLMKLDKGNPTRIKQLLHQVHLARLNDIRKIGTQTWVGRLDQIFKTIYGKGLVAIDQDWHHA